MLTNNRQTDVELCARGEIPAQHSPDVPSVSPRFRLRQASKKNAAAP